MASIRKIILDDKVMYAKQSMQRELEAIDKAFEIATAREKFLEERNKKVDKAKTDILARISHEFQSSCAKDSNVHAYVQVQPDKQARFSQLKDLAKKEETHVNSAGGNSNVSPIFIEDAQKILMKMNDNGVDLRSLVLLSDNFMYTSGKIVPSGTNMHLHSKNGETRRVIITQISREKIEVQDLSSRLIKVISRGELEARTYYFTLEI